MGCKVLDSVVTADVVDRGLLKAETTAREDQALRMRYGASLDEEALLPRVVEPESALGEELLLIEQQLLAAAKRRGRRLRGPAAATDRKGRIMARLKEREREV